MERKREGQREGENVRCPSVAFLAQDKQDDVSSTAYAIIGGPEGELADSWENKWLLF